MYNPIWLEGLDREFDGKKINSQKIIPPHALDYLLKCAFKGKLPDKYLF